MAATINVKSQNRSRDMVSAQMTSLISWRSIFAGLFVSFLTLMALMGLGMAFGGIGLDDGSTIRSAGIFTGTWFVVSILIAMCAGSYFAARISKFYTPRIGAAHGLVITALFFTVLMLEVGMGVGALGQAAGGAVRGTAGLAQSPMVRTVVEDMLADLNLKSQPEEVATGVMSRLLQGEVDSAVNYLARQANLSSMEARVRLDELRARFDSTVINARQVAAGALKATGWSILFSVILGALAGAGGGMWGSRVNKRKPLIVFREDVSAAS